MGGCDENRLSFVDPCRGRGVDRGGFSRHLLRPDRRNRTLPPPSPARGDDLSRRRLPRPARVHRRSQTEPRATLARQFEPRAAAAMGAFGTNTQTMALEDPLAPNPL